MDEALISQIPIFSSLQPGEIKLLLGNLRPVEIPAGQLLFLEGDRGDRFYIILEGRLEIIKALGTSEERLLNVRESGEYIGEMSLLDPDGTRTASVRCSTPSRLLEMTRADFDLLLEERPVIACEMARALSRRLRDTDNATIRDLQEKNQQLHRALEDLKAAQAQIIQKEKLERELQVAREIQMSMVPRRLPVFPGYNFGARMDPARAVGGDFFDFVPLDQSRLGIAIGDVSDKGVPAAIFMAMTRSVMRAEARSAAFPREALEGVNRHLTEMNDAGMFVTILYGILDRVTHEFTYARAGHTVPMVCKRQGSVSVLPWSVGQPLGVLSDPAIDEQTVRLSPGDVLLIYTDGMTDATEPSEELFGMDRLQDALARCCQTPAQALCDHLVETVVSYQQGRPQDDDMTVVAVQVAADLEEQQMMGQPVF